MKKNDLIPAQVRALPDGLQVLPLLRGKIKHLLVITLTLVFTGIFTGCDQDDDVVLEPWEVEVNQLRDAVAPYFDLEDAIEAGYYNEFTGYRTQMGYHYMNPSLVDEEFEIEKPEVLMFAPDEQENMQFVGVEYAVPIADMDNPPPAPEGFTGGEDVWAINTEFNVWTLHVWVGLDNPNGLFTPLNPELP